MDDLNEIETPAFVVDEAVALRNIAAYQSHCDEVGLKLRPHIKTHKLVHFAKAQMDAGAAGITCQKIGEAEVMADAGLDDILITFNVIGSAKLDRLYGLARKVRELAVTADNADVIGGLAETFRDAGSPLRVLVECDTGAHRCGVTTPEAAADLTRMIDAAPGLVFGGLMTYPAPGGRKDVANFMTATCAILSRAGIDCPEISSGGTPDMWQADKSGGVTEYRAGTYIYNDRSLIKRGVCTLDDCAGRVVATVVSRPAGDRAVIDAGSKVLTSDLLGLSGYGLIVGHPTIAIEALSEEHGTLTSDGEMPLAVGDRIEIVPNHVCVVSNMFDAIWLRTADGSLRQMRVDARGCVT
ncbi:D-TA family PLP-dependent enzyme [Notoacmeibacter sp. MSK16QG-6]|uniref:D-TA family PLP-dependent enzyme n=1 Tax=Notoacmeibacter sp. MSK16QG-6 TaxID=2957982 RepID=UPI00209EE79F|nr:D-TA family PLP-dependent enzyme [Notoacmeibacter sp. MSK16QG-6]MCP1200251.1 D-TA family PLP-dependent enzyme [Notoacmeibacter sp. MSK16QG-6]